MKINYLELEKKFINEEFDYKEGFIIKKGKIPVIITACHSVSQMRLGKEKQGEYRTGVIGEEIHQRTGCYLGMKTKNLNDDSNFDEKSEFREEVEKVIKEEGIRVLIDIHLSSPKRKFDIDIGTSYGENLCGNEEYLNLVKEELSKIYRATFVDDTFRASHKYTMSKVISTNCKVPSLQIEINWRLVDTIEELEELINILSKIIEELGRKT